MSHGATNFTGFTGTFTGSTAGSISGDLTLAAGMTYSHTGGLSLTGSATLTTNGKTIGETLTIASSGTVVIADALAASNVTIQSGAFTFAGFTVTCTAFTVAHSGTWALSGAATIVGQLTLTSGTMAAGAYAVAITRFALGAGTKVLTMSGTWTLNGTGTIWDAGTNGTGFTLTATGSTILVPASASDVTFAGGSGNTYETLTWSGAGVGVLNISGSNTFAELEVTAAPHTIKFEAGSTTTVTTWSVTGTVGNLITLDTITGTGQFTLTKAGGGYVSCDYMSISNSAATPGVTWFAGLHSTDVTNNDGWLFTTPDIISMLMTLQLKARVIL
jgi:hypothetical protein